MLSVTIDWSCFEIVTSSCVISVGKMTVDSHVTTSSPMTAVLRPASGQMLQVMVIHKPYPRWELILQKIVYRLWKSSHWYKCLWLHRGWNLCPSGIENKLCILSGPNLQWDSGPIQPSFSVSVKIAESCRTERQVRAGDNGKKWYWKSTSLL